MSFDFISVGEIFIYIVKVVNNGLVDFEGVIFVEIFFEDVIFVFVSFVFFE